MSFIRNWFQHLFQVVSGRRSNTVRTMFSLVGIAMLLGAAVISSTEVSYIRLQSTQTVIEAGQRFTIEVYAYAHVPVNAVDVTLRFDANAVEVIGVDRGQSVLTIWTEDPIIKSDRVILRGGTFRKGFLGEHQIATIDLRAKQSGQSEMFAANVLLLAGDGKGTPVTIAEAKGSTLNLYVYDENTDPANIGVDIAVAIITDIDGSGEVDLTDISSFMASWGKKDRLYDFNNDGKMSIRDFSILLADFFSGG